MNITKQYSLLKILNLNQESFNQNSKYMNHNNENQNIISNQQLPLPKHLLDL